MKVHSSLADMDIRIGAVRRAGHELLLQSAPGSSMDATIAVSAREALAILGKVLGSGGGLVFVLGLPFFWLKQTVAADQSSSTSAPAGEQRSGDINKPW